MKHKRKHLKPLHNSQAFIFHHAWKEYAAMTLPKALDGTSRSRFKHNVLNVISVRRLCLALFALVLCSALPANAQEAKLRIGFIVRSIPKTMAPANSSAIAFAKTKGDVTLVYPAPDNSWRDSSGEIRILDEFDVVWCHEAANPADIQLPSWALEDIKASVGQGSCFLVTAAAGRLLRDMDLEPLPLRQISGGKGVAALRMIGKHKEHPVFAGLDTSENIPLTADGGFASSDFQGVFPGPSGEILANGSYGAGERPLVEYSIGKGKLIFLGWRLPDFRDEKDIYRSNLDRFFGNLIGYLAGRNQNRTFAVRPPGKSTYARVLGVPFLIGENVADLSVPAEAAGKTAIVLAPEKSSPAAHASEKGQLLELGKSISTAQRAMGLTLTSNEAPVATFKANCEAQEARVAKIKAEQDALDEKDRIASEGFRVVKPEIANIAAPLQPTVMPDTDQSVLLGHNPFQGWDDEKRGPITKLYEPLEDGGFRISGSPRKLNRAIIHGQHRLLTGDAPLFSMLSAGGVGVYATDRVFPLWPRPDGKISQTSPTMGRLRLGIPEANGRQIWLDDVKDITTEFRPGYTDYRILNTSAGEVRIRMAPTMGGHGFVCRVEFEKEAPLVWQFGGIWWALGEKNKNQAKLTQSEVSITEPNLPNGLVMAGWDGKGTSKILKAPYGDQAEFQSAAGGKVYHIYGVWGVTQVDRKEIESYLARLDRPESASWPKERDQLKKLWEECYIGAALDPEKRFQGLAANPDAALQQTCSYWDKRRSEFQVRTPDAHVNGLINWARCTSEYHRRGPGFVLGTTIWQMYSHISVGWYGKEWGGDHEEMESCLRLYGAMQQENGFIRWIAPSLAPMTAENNTPYWVDHVWRHYSWTGNTQFLKDLWPNVRNAVGWMKKQNDPDGDGLFSDPYEYWNCDSNGKGPKAAAPTGMSWAMFDRAAKIAHVLGDAKAEAEYQALADKTKQAAFQQLWRDNPGILGSIGQDNLWRSHPQVWEQFLPINAGLLDAEKGRKATRWIAAHYGYEPNPGIRLLTCSDWWPIRWSCQWVPTGDTLLTVLAGMKSGDGDLWWPYFKTVVMSAFRSNFPGINMGISNSGCGGGDPEIIDSDDPHMYATIRGLFGIEPAIDEQTLSICPAFPSDWTSASIKTPDVSYEYQRNGETVTFKIRTAKPLKKRVKANFTGREIITPAELESVVKLKRGPALPPPEPAKKPTILFDQHKAKESAPLSPGDLKKLVLFDFSQAYNTSLLEMYNSARFIFDYGSSAYPVTGFWHNPAPNMVTSPRVVTIPSGVRFLTAGHPVNAGDLKPKNILALSSWRPYPFPAAAVVPVGFNCSRVWLLTSDYVHPMKNYIPNGEIILRYKSGEPSVVSLVPPYNIDCTFQHFALEGTPVPLGRVEPTPIWYDKMLTSHADALEVPCDKSRQLESIELRATCSEGIIGLIGISALAE